MIVPFIDHACGVVLVVVAPMRRNIATDTMTIARRDFRIGVLLSDRFVWTGRTLCSGDGKANRLFLETLQNRPFARLEQRMSSLDPPHALAQLFRQASFESLDAAVIGVREDR